MTILTKTSITITKTPLIKESKCDELSFKPPNGRDADPLRENQKKKRICVCACGCGFRMGARKVKRDKIIRMPGVSPTGTRVRAFGALLCTVITMFLLVVMGIFAAMQIYVQVTNDMSQHNRYQGFCAIPLSKLQDLQMLESHKMMALQWKTTPNIDRDEPNIQVVSMMDEDPDHLFDLLREVLDIDIDESVEKISVFNNGHPVSFIHDFESNVTGIVDTERCFTMDMDPELVLQPEQFLLGLQRGDQFDVTRVRSQLRALLPPAARAPPAALLRACAQRPVYRLHKDAGVVIRKRSADAPPHDFMQFAGKRVQEIEISNLAELLEFEQDNRPAH